MRNQTVTSLLTYGEAAARARLGESTLKRFMAQGRGPALTRLGGRRFVREDHLVQWLNANTSHGASGTQAA